MPGAFAKATHVPGIPSNGVFPVPSAIVYPSLFTAAGVNPAALPQKAKITGLQLTYSPPVSKIQEFTAAFASGRKNFGWGVGYEGKLSDSTGHGLYAGAGFKAQSTSIGISVRANDLSTGAIPETDLGILADLGRDLSLGLVLYHMDTSPQMNLGIGFSNDKNYSFEVNLLMPKLESILVPGNDFVVTVATQVYASIFGLSFRSTYFTSKSRVDQSVSLLLRFSRSFLMTLQYSSPNRTYYGVIVLF